jgi:hypothetical protein
MVLLSVAVGVYVSPYWHFLSVIVGLNLIRSSLTGFCPAAMIFKKFRAKPGGAFTMFKATHIAAKAWTQLSVRTLLFRFP